MKKVNEHCLLDTPPPTPTPTPIPRKVMVDKIAALFRMLKNP